MQIPTLTEIKLLQKSRVVQIQFDNGEKYELPCEYLRVFSPSAEVQGHGLAEPMLVAGKKHVNITSIEPVGQYAVKLIFDDGHKSGLYSFETLYKLGLHYKENWQRYLHRLEQAGLTRE